MKMRAQAGVLCTALMMGALTLLTQSQTASAITIQPGALNTSPQNAEIMLPVEKVGHRGKRHHRYNRHRHGRRYRHRHGRYKHYYGGYWYGVPWWLGRPYYGTPYYDPYYDVEPAPTSGAHEEWCYRKYRSYNARTDTFRGYDGYDHRCISPYS